MSLVSQAPSAPFPGTDRWFLRTRPGRATVAAIVGLVLAALPAHVAASHYDNYVLLAQAFLHHRLWIDWPGGEIDAVLHGGHRYVVNDPVPALLLVPYVAFAGAAANQTLLGVLLAAVAAGAAWCTAENLGVPLWRTFVLCAFMFAGTDLWWAATLGDVWFLAQTSAVAFTLLALAELSGSRPRGCLVALWYALAVGSRFTLVLGVPVFAYLVYRGGIGERPQHTGSARRLAAFLGVVAVFAALWVWYNRARWGVWWDRGHTIFYHEDQDVGSPSGSPFGLQNLPMQLQSFFLAPPQLVAYAPFVIPQIKGTALIYTSPALVYAFLARSPRATVLAMWLAVILVAAPSFLYYVNGYAQFGMRHALDFEPFLFVLMLLAARIELPAWSVWLVLYSIAATAYGIWFWLTIVRPDVLGISA